MSFYDEEMQVEALMESLPKSWDFIKDLYMNTCYNEASLERLIGMLRDEGERRERRQRKRDKDEEDEDEYEEQTFGGDDFEVEKKRNWSDEIGVVVVVNISELFCFVSSLGIIICFGL
ncbi:hypothetical protein IFM89_012255 [Coptis chinensis]|uniref:Uncharacterized protein n=1 Tax=Coptis chinensis TaxID=261450 RepID=A0A835HDM1_9MAGN|nr:hypothetical protein IFM89_012255 [Coptis chinensis]